MMSMHDDEGRTPDPWDPLAAPPPEGGRGIAPQAVDGDQGTAAPQRPGEPTSPAQSPSQSLSQVPQSTRRRGPGWCGVSALVVLGMVLSSGATLGGIVAYDQVIGPLVGASPTSGSPSNAPSGTDAEPVSTGTVDGADWSAVVEQVTPSVVAIQVRTATGSSQGSGVVLSKDGSILTNNHVITGGEVVQVTLADGLTYTASVVGVDAATDLAMVRLDAPPSTLQPAVFGDSEQVQVGDPVLAAGTPLGLANTVTTGIVSAVDRPVSTVGEEKDGSDATFTSAIQTDAAINPGNSGGPLVDANGQVVGINTAIAAIPGTDRAAGSIGLGFAIPSNTARLIADQLEDSGSVQHAYVGVTSQDGAREVGDVTHRGAEVVGVEPDSPAEKAGAKDGDLIIAFDDVAIGSAAALTAVVRGEEVGSEHTLTLVRNQEEHTLEITLAEKP